MGRQWLGGPRGHAQPRAEACEEARQVVAGDGDVGDERGRDPGRAGDRTVPLLKQLLKGTRAPNAQSEKMLELLIAWRHHGGNRLDLNDDGLIDDPGAAIMDAAWTKIANAFMKPQLGRQRDELASLFSRFDAPPGGQYSGWYQYFDRDIRRLLGKNQKQPFANRYCGGGNLQRCRRSIWEAIAAAGDELTSQQGTSVPSE